MSERARVESERRLRVSEGCPDIKITYNDEICPL